MKQIIVVLIIAYCATVYVNAISIEDKVDLYFKSNTVAALKNAWQKQRRSFENIIALSVKESYAASSGSMNVYVDRLSNPHALGDGFYVTDSIVHLILQNPLLRELPHLFYPDIAFPLHDNVIRVETPLSKMFIDSEYSLLRNQSSLIYEGHQDILTQSPFALQQVQSRGNVTIVCQDCHLVGQAVVTLTGLYLHVSHCQFRVLNCKFNVEISNPGIESPPVISPYFSAEQGLQLERLLSKPLVDEMWPKLQGAMVTMVNTTAIFGPDMFSFRKHQKEILKESADFMSLLARHIKKTTIKKNQGVVNLNDLRVTFDDAKCTDDCSKNQVNFLYSNVTMNGMDLVYSARKGGPIRSKGQNQIAEELRLARLQIRGNIYLENSTTTGVYDSFIEIVDVGINLIFTVDRNIDQEEKKKLSCVQDAWRTKSVNTFEVTGWRSIEYNIVERCIKSQEQMAAEALIAGYLSTEVPRVIGEHLKDVFQDAVEKAEDENYGYLASGSAGDGNNVEIDGHYDDNDVNKPDQGQILKNESGYKKLLHLNRPAPQSGRRQWTYFRH